MSPEEIKDTVEVCAEVVKCGKVSSCTDETGQIQVEIFATDTEVARKDVAARLTERFPKARFWFLMYKVNKPAGEVAKKVTQVAQVEN